MDIATVGVVSVLAVAADGTCQDAKIALGAVAPTAIRARAAEALLVGQPLEAQRYQQAAEAAAQAANPIDDIRSTAAYRKAVVAPLVARTLHYAAQMAQGTPLTFQIQRGLAVEAIF
jgi:carbon-monoxide dehydrogenase medium subunit